MQGKTQSCIGILKCQRHQLQQQSQHDSILQMCLKQVSLKSNVTSFPHCWCCFEEECNTGCGDSRSAKIDTTITLWMGDFVCLCSPAVEGCTATPLYALIHRSTLWPVDSSFSRQSSVACSFREGVSVKTAPDTHGDTAASGKCCTREAAWRW